MTALRHFAFVGVATLAGCGASPPDDFTDGVLELPAVLREVSAITLAADGRVACMQDEFGAIHLIDLAGRQAPVATPFGGRGDYEGLARVGADYWVLRSDGHVARITTDASGWRIAESVRLPAGEQEWEGLCHDAAGNRLLAMTKTGAGQGKDARDVRSVWAIDLLTRTVAIEPVLQLRRSAIVEQADAQRIELPTRVTPKGEERIDLELVCNEILVVPATGEWLVLLAQDHLLLRIDASGRLLAAKALDPELLPQAEGMTFLADGRLLIASEGVSGPARLVVVAMP
jgi:hypothetical protein